MHLKGNPSIRWGILKQEGEVQNVAVLQMYVSQNGINIMGRDGLTKLNITITPEMFGRVATIEPVLPAPLQDLLNVYEDLFKPELGHCVTTTANLCLRENSLSFVSLENSPLP